MQVDAAAGRDFERGPLGAVEQAGVDPRVLMDQRRALGGIGRGDQTQTPAFVLGREVSLLVARLEPEPIRLDPDLEEVHGLGARRVELAVAHAAAGAHPLHVAGADGRAVADRILVRQLAREHVGDDLHVAVAVRAEAGAGLHPILVDHPQRPELDVFGIEVVGERKGVVGLEPAVIGVAPFVAAANLDHADLLGLPR